MSFVSSGTHIFASKTLTLQLHLFKLIMNGSSFKNRQLVWLETLATRNDDSLKLNNTINACLKRLKIILCYSLSLGTCQC